MANKTLEMKRFSLCASISLVMVLCLGLTGCPGNRKQPKQSQKVMVAILKNSKIDFWNQVAAGFSSECVKDLLSAPQSKNHFISPICFDAETLENLPEEARPIMGFLQDDQKE